MDTDRTAIILGSRKYIRLVEKIHMAHLTMLANSALAGRLFRSSCL
jgi:hypothetical protein